jgi:hypothetical protein
MANYTDDNDSLAWIMLQRTGGGPVSMDEVTSMFVELLEHEDECECGKCGWVRVARPDTVLRSAHYWSRCARGVLG